MQLFSLYFRNGVLLSSLLAVGTIGQLSQDNTVFVGVEVESEVIYNGFDVAGCPHVLLSPLLGCCQVAQHSQDESPVDCLPAPSQVL